MANVSLLDLTRSIVRQHQRTDNNEAVIVLPTVHDSVDIEHDALGAIIARYGGTYLRCDDAAPEPHRARGPINHTMASHLKELCAARNMPITVSEHDNYVGVTANDYAEPTGSLPVVLRVLATLASSELNVRLAVLSYPLDGLDEVRAALLWEATMAPRHFAPPDLRTFVPIAGGDVDVPTHCNRPEGAVRFVVRDDDVIERGTSRLLSASLQMILSDLDRPLVLFLGAGASASCNVPQGNRMRDQALVSLTQKPLSSAGLVSDFRQWLTDHDRWMNDEQDLPSEIFERNLTLERVLREEFYALSGRSRSESATVQRMQRDCTRALDRYPDGRQALWRLVAELPRAVVATVNFDQLIEVGMPTQHAVIIGRDSFARHRELVVARLRGETTCVPILKIHGSIEDPNSLVADITTTSRGLPAEISATLDAMLSNAPYLTWIWIGCSMRDADLGSWLAGKSGGKEIQEWWVDPLPPRSLMTYAQQRRLGEWAQMDQSLRDRVITETSDRFLAGLASHVTQLQERASDVS
jgi:hypothetical protein